MLLLLLSLIAIKPKTVPKGGESRTRTMICVKLSKHQKPSHYLNIHCDSKQQDLLLFPLTLSFSIICFICLHLNIRGMGHSILSIYLVLKNGFPNFTFWIGDFHNLRPSEWRTFISSEAVRIAPYFINYLL